MIRTRTKEMGGHILLGREEVGSQRKALRKFPAMEDMDQTTFYSKKQKPEL